MRVLRLELSVEVSPTRDDRGASAAESYAIRLDLHPRWIRWHEAGREITLDFDRRRRCKRDAATGEFDDVSLLADAHFRSMELANRAHVRGVIEAGGASLPGFGPVFTEHQLSMLDRGRRTTLTGRGLAVSLRSMFGMRSRFDIEASDAGDEARYVHDGRELLAHARRGFPAAPAIARAFVHFVRYRFSGHPLALRRLEEADFVPASLRLSARMPIDLDGGVVTARVSSATELDAEPPVRSGRFAVFGEPRERVDAHIERLREAGFRDHRPPPGERVEAAVDAAREGRVFEATTAFMALALEREVTMPPALAAALHSTHEARARRLLGLMQSPQDADHARASMEGYAALRRGDDPHPEFLLTQEAVVRRRLGDQAGAVACYCDALDHNPFLLGAYKDLGDCYLAAYDTRRAWRCWEAARQLDPAHPMLRDVDELERHVVAAHPEYFTAPGDEGVQASRPT